MKKKILVLVGILTFCFFVFNTVKINAASPDIIFDEEETGVRLCSYEPTGDDSIELRTGEEETGVRLCSFDENNQEMNQAF